MAWHLAVFGVLLPPLAYNLGVMYTRGGRWHHAVSVGLYTGLAVWEVAQIFRHLDHIHRTDTAELS